MTVEQLIKELQKVENKNMKVYFDDEEWGERESSEILIRKESIVIMSNS